jgi:hypothetical protein
MVVYVLGMPLILALASATVDAMGWVAGTLVGATGFTTLFIAMLWASGEL